MASEKRLAEVQRKLEAAGYQLVRVRGSHHIFAKSGATPLSIPVQQGKVKPFCVREIEKICRDA